jgi:hypothetical protein
MKPSEGLPILMRLSLLRGAGRMKNCTKKPGFLSGPPQTQNFSGMGKGLILF